MKQYRPLLFIVITLLIGWTLLIQEACGQQLKQIQKGTANNQIPVTNGYQNTLVYRNAIPYILDTLGIRDSLTMPDSIFLRDSVIVLRDGSGFVYKSRIYNFSPDFLLYYNIPNPQKGDIWVPDPSEPSEKAKYYDGSSWVTFDHDSHIGNEGFLQLLNRIDYWNRVGIHSSGFGLGSEVAVQGDTLIRVSYDEIVPVLRLNIDTTQLNIRINNFISDSLATVVSAPDSTIIKKLWGITLDSVGNTYSIGADSAQVTSIYQNSLKQNTLISGTNIKTVNGNTLLGSGNVTVGTFTLPALTNGSVLFSDGTTIAQDNANFYWDDTNNELEIKSIPIGSRATGQLYVGVNAGLSATSAIYSNFFGLNAGSGATSASFCNFFGINAGLNVTSATSSNFFGNASGSGATSASYSNFFGINAGLNATSATYSNFYGFKAGASFSGNSLGSNNIIIGSNISLPNATANSLNIGGVLFGTGLQSSLSGNPKIVATSGGKIGVMTVTPVQTFDVTGTMRVTGSDGTSTTIMGRDGDGDVSGISPSFGINLASNLLKIDTLVVATPYNLTLKEPIIVAGNTAQYWRGDKTWQTLNTSIVPELSNLYFTDARARAAISLTTTGTTGASTYNSSTGVLNIPNYATGLTSLNGLTSATQIFDIGTSGSDFNISSASSTHTFNLPTASGSVRGALSSANWTTFNNKQNQLTGATGQTLYFSATNTPTATYQVFINGSGQVGINNPSPAYHLDVSGSMHASAGFYDSSGDFGNAGQVLTGQGFAATNWETPPTASSSVTGYLSSTDWTTFNNKVGGSGTTNKLAYWNGTNTIAANGNFHLDNTNSTLSIGVGSAGTYPLDIQSNGASQALRAMNAATTKGFTVTPTTTANAQSVGVYGNVLIDGQIHSSTQTPAYGTSGQVLTSQGTGDWIWTTPSSGTVSSFSSGNLSPLFTTSVSNSTTTPALSFSLSSVANANYIYASPNGSSGTPSFRAIVPADIPTLNQNTTGTAGSAGALITPRTIGIVTGDASSAGSSFNGTANNTNALTLATVNSNVGTFTNATVTVNAKGLVTAASSGASSATNLSFSGASSPYTLNSSTGTDVTFTAGSNITLSGSASNLTINNPAPDQVVSITGAGTNVVTGAYPSFTITDKSTTTQTFTSSGTYTKPAGAKSVYVRVIGAGGGGGGGSKFATSTFTPGGGGGNGGGISEYTFHADDVPSSVTVIVGAGGGGGTGATVNSTEGVTGTTGGVSNFGTLLYAEGGLGGKSFDAQKESLGVIEDGGVGAYYSGAGAAFTAANTKVSPTGGGAGGYISAANATNNSNVTAGTLVLTSNSGTPNTGIRSGIGGVGGNASTSGNGSAGTAAAATGYGAGGGGGGAARNSVGNGGAGASGRQGAVIVITYF